MRAPHPPEGASAVRTASRRGVCGHRCHAAASLRTDERGNDVCLRAARRRAPAGPARHDRWRLGHCRRAPRSPGRIQLWRHARGADDVLRHWRMGDRARGRCLTGRHGWPLQALIPAAGGLRPRQVRARGGWGPGERHTSAVIRPPQAGAQLHRAEHALWGHARRAGGHSLRVQLWPAVAGNGGPGQRLRRRCDQHQRRAQLRAGRG